jgi:hypothetical protein
LQHNDSVYVFVTVHIDPTAVTTPFLCKTVLAGIQWQFEKGALEAYGLNAHFLRKYKSLQTRLDNDLPYVLLDTF